MYTGSHLKLILAILLIPSVFIFLIAADSENRNFNSDSESTVEKISLSPVDKDISLPTEDKILIKSGDTFYSTLTKFDVSPATINKIGQDRKLRDFISLQVNDQIYITSKNGLVFVKRFDDDFYLDVLTINDSNYTFEKNRDNLERIAQFREFVIKDSLYASSSSHIRAAVESSHGVCALPNTYSYTFISLYSSGINHSDCNAASNVF